MVIKIGKPDTDIESNVATEKNKRVLFPLFPTVALIVVVLALLAFLVVNLPGRYKATVVGESAVKDVFVLDTVKGNIWRYQCTRDTAVLTYLGKLKTGEKVPERLVIK